MDSGKEVRELAGFGRLVFSSSRLLHSFFPVLSDFALLSRMFFDGETDVFIIIIVSFLRDGCPKKKYEGTNGVAAFVGLRYVPPPLGSAYPNINPLPCPLPAQTNYSSPPHT
jgi:hypothetical protein